MTSRRAVRALVFAAFFLSACGAAPVAAAGEKTTPAAPTATATAGASRGGAAIAPTAIAVDEYGVTIEVKEPVFVRPPSGFFGGKGTKMKDLRIWRGAFEVTVPLADIAKIEVTGAKDGDLVAVRVTTRSGDVVEGKVERDLELQGRIDYGSSSIKFERLRSVTLGT